MAKTVKTFLLGVVGESHNNQDGSSRQKNIRKMREGETVRFVPEPDNHYSKNAVGVWGSQGQVGYVPEKNARLMARDIASPKTTVEGRVRAINCQGIIFKRCGVVLDVKITHTVKDR